MQVEAVNHSPLGQELPEVLLSETDEKIVDLTGNIQYEVTTTLTETRPISRIKDSYLIAVWITNVALVIIGSTVILSIHESTTAVLIGGGMAVTGAVLIAGSFYLTE